MDRIFKTHRALIEFVDEVVADYTRTGLYVAPQELKPGRNDEGDVVPWRKRRAFPVGINCHSLRVIVRGCAKERRSPFISLDHQINANVRWGIVKIPNLKKTEALLTSLLLVGDKFATEHLARAAMSSTSPPTVAYINGSSVITAYVNNDFVPNYIETLVRNPHWRKIMCLPDEVKNEAG